MAKFIVYSDLHVHPHGASAEKLDNCIDCLAWIYKEAENRNIKHIIFAGDLFHDRHRINVYSYDKVYEILNKYSSKINSYYLVGNHDMFYRDVRSVISTKALSNILKVISEPETIKIADLFVDFLPYTEHPEKEIKDNFSKSKSRLLVSHLAIKNATINTLWGVKNLAQDDFEEEIAETQIEILSNYEKVLLGHYHARQKIKGTNIEYIGSPLQLSFGEAMDKKGFLILDSETLKTEFIENTFSPKYFIIPYDKDIKKYDIDGGYVKLYVTDFGKTDLIDLKKKVKEEFNLKSIEVHSVDHTKKEIGKKEIENIELLSSDHKSMISEYIKNIEIELDKDRLIKIGLEIINTTGQEVVF